MVFWQVRKLSKDFMIVFKFLAILSLSLMCSSALSFIKKGGVRAKVYETKYYYESFYLGDDLSRFIINNTVRWNEERGGFFCGGLKPKPKPKPKPASATPALGYCGGVKYNPATHKCCGSGDVTTKHGRCSNK